MIKISIKDAQIGMVAAEPIKTPLGQILALPGTPTHPSAHQQNEAI